MKSAGPGQSPLLLLDVIDILNKLNIPYAVVEALAASFYGTIRASMDADAIISFQNDKEDPQALLNELIKTGFEATQTRGDTHDPVAGVIDIKDNYSNRVDLLTGIRGMKADVFSRTIDVLFSGKKIRIIGLEDFIAMKIFAASLKDIEDAKNAMKVSAERINPSLLKTLVSNSGKGALKTLEKLLKEVKNKS